MLYWNLYHAPLKRAVFVIVAVLFAITDIFQYKSIVDVSHQKKIMTTFAIKRMLTIMILMMVVRIKHTD